GQYVRTGADRVRAEIESVSLDNLACDGGRAAESEAVEESEVGLFQPDAQRVTVDDLETRDRRVVVELPGLFRLCARFFASHDLAIDEPGPGTPHFGVEQPLERVDLVRRGQLARLALERGIGGEKDALAQPERIGLAAVRYGRHRLQRSRHKLHR